MNIGAKRVLLAFGGLLVGVGLFEYLTNVGGLRPDYKPLDFDARLTREAATGLDLMHSIEKFRREHGSFPATFASAPVPGGWEYSRDSGGLGYTLSRKLGWDPRLIYAFDGVRGRWIFDPGDGSPQRTILLVL